MKIDTTTLAMPALFLLVVVSACDDSSGPVSADGMRYPLESWDVIQEFGVWNSSWQGYHLAEDARAAAGDPVYAMADGTVGGIFVAQGYGAVMLIEHRFAGGFATSLYGHISQLHGFEVEAGESVSKGQLLAYIAEDDEDGGAWAPHLHFGVRRGPYSIDEEICGVWLYVGYTRECPGVSHEEHRSYWLDPGDFITGLATLTSAEQSVG
jgi:murein DD-endopeptidase MepM/ murein hydrolase activator NlpD